MNRHGSLGPAAGQRSRGELVLEALDHADAVAAATALAHLDPAAYRTFNLIVADNRDAFWLRHSGPGPIEARPLADGLSLIAAGDLNETETPRLALAGPRFRAAPAPDPDRGDWTAWQDLLGDDKAPPGATAEAALRFRTDARVCHGVERADRAASGAVARAAGDISLCRLAARALAVARCRNAVRGVLQKLAALLYLAAIPD